MVLYKVENAWDGPSHRQKIACVVYQSLPNVRIIVIAVGWMRLFMKRPEDFRRFGLVAVRLRLLVVVVAFAVIVRRLVKEIAFFVGKTKEKIGISPPNCHYNVVCPSKSGADTVLSPK